MQRELLLIGLMLGSFAACAGPPKIECPCKDSISMVVEQSDLYQKALLDKGMLSEALKACERRAR